MWKLDTGRILPARVTPDARLQFAAPGVAAAVVDDAAAPTSVPTGTPLTPLPAPEADHAMAPHPLWTLGGLPVALSGSLPESAVPGIRPEDGSGVGTVPFPSRFIRSMAPPPSSGRIQASAEEAGPHAILRGEEGGAGGGGGVQQPPGVTPLPIGLRGLLSVTPSPALSAPTSVEIQLRGQGSRVLGDTGAMPSDFGDMSAPSALAAPARSLSLGQLHSPPGSAGRHSSRSPSLAARGLPTRSPSRAAGGAHAAVFPVGRSLLSPRQHLHSAVSPLMSMLRGNRHPTGQLGPAATPQRALFGGNNASAGEAAASPVQPLLSSPCVLHANGSKARAASAPADGGGGGPPPVSGGEGSRDYYDDDKENVDPLAPSVNVHTQVAAVGGNIDPMAQAAATPGWSAGIRDVGRVLVLPADPAEGVAQMGSLGVLEDVLMGADLPWEVVRMGADMEVEVEAEAASLSPLTDPENRGSLPPHLTGNMATLAASSPPSAPTPQHRDSAIALITVIPGDAAAAPTEAFPGMAGLAARGAVLKRPREEISGISGGGDAALPKVEADVEVAADHLPLDRGETPKDEALEASLAALETEDGDPSGRYETGADVAEGVSLSLCASLVRGTYPDEDSRPTSACASSPLVFDALGWRRLMRDVEAPLPGSGGGGSGEENRKESKRSRLDGPSSGAEEAEGRAETAGGTAGESILIRKGQGSGAASQGAKVEFASAAERPHCQLSNYLDASSRCAWEPGDPAMRPFSCSEEEEGEGEEEEGSEQEEADGLEEGGEDEGDVERRADLDRDLGPGVRIIRGGALPRDSPVATAAPQAPAQRYRPSPCHHGLPRATPSPLRTIPAGQAGNGNPVKARQSGPLAGVGNGGRQQRTVSPAAATPTPPPPPPPAHAIPAAGHDKPKQRTLLQCWGVK